MTLNARITSSPARLTRTALAASLLALAGVAQAGAVDAANDFIPTFTGRHGGDLDVLSANVDYNVNSHVFSLMSTVGANIGTTAGGFYVWGVNRGAGTARFANIGATGVLFDMVVVINQDGSVAVNDLVGGVPSFTLGAGSAHFSGATMTLDLDDSHLLSRGFSQANYTWNLWPRDPRGTVGTAAISDFAPDNTNFATNVVPEPTSALLAMAGLGLVLVSGRRKAR
jgi:hypothetical protein